MKLEGMLPFFYTAMRLLPLIEAAISFVEQRRKAMHGREKQDEAMRLIGVSAKDVSGATELLQNPDVRAAIRRLIDAIVGLANAVQKARKV